MQSYDHSISGFYIRILYQDSISGFYFITICTHQREHLLGRIENGDMILNRNGSIAHQYCEKIDVRFPRCRTRAFVVMPNHIHGIIEIISNSNPVRMIHESSPINGNNKISKPVRMIHESSLPTNRESSPIIGNNKISNHVGSIHELTLRDHNPDIETNRKHRRKMIIPMVIGWYKMNVSKQINLHRKTPGSRIWQPNYYEHIIRNQTAFNNITEYIQNNPSTWNLDKFR